MTVAIEVTEHQESAVDVLNVAVSVVVVNVLNANANLARQAKE
jgi:hypothetical protein